MHVGLIIVGLGGISVRLLAQVAKPSVLRTGLHSSTCKKQ